MNNKKFTKVAGYKINIQKLNIFMYANNDQLENIRSFLFQRINVTRICKIHLNAILKQA